MHALKSTILVVTILAATSCTTVGVKGPVVQPDLSSRPLRVTAERQMDIPADVLYQAWTSMQFERWLSAPGTLLMKPEVNSPFFFEILIEGERHPHYGRFLELKTNRLIKMAWVNDCVGIRGVETVVTLEFIAEGDGTLVRVTHEGLPDELSRDQHQEGWLMVLDHLYKTFASAN